MYKVTRHNSPREDGDKFIRPWTLSVTVEPDENNPDADPNVFVYNSRKTVTVNDADMFSNVASLYDMNTIPVGEPQRLPEEFPMHDNIPYYRTNTVTLDLPNMSVMERVWNIIRIDIRLLVKEYNAAHDLHKESEEVII